MKPIGCTETSAMNYHYSLRNNPEERISQYVQVIRIENVQSSTSTRSVSESDNCGGLKYQGVDGLEND
jgi:hypothetical protein